MPKMKTHRGAAKQFKVTGTGKSCAGAFKHILENKPQAHAPGPPRPSPPATRPHQAVLGR